MMVQLTLPAPYNSTKPMLRSTATSFVASKSIKKRFFPGVRQGSKCLKKLDPVLFFAIIDW
jgi:hypothetical protein